MEITMTTKTDATCECAEEIGKRFAGEWIAGPDTEELIKIIAKHFPPSVPVSKLEALQRYDDWRPDPNGDSVSWADIEALIAEAK
jgi:hypothetical protein